MTNDFDKEAWDQSWKFKLCNYIRRHWNLNNVTNFLYLAILRLAPKYFIWLTSSTDKNVSAFICKTIASE